LNLYINAADAMPGGGELTIKTSNVNHEDMKGKSYDPKPGNYVMLTVTDTGVGMDKRTMTRIFDPFFTTKEMGRGTGLGLASVYGIIKGHAGYIDVESKNDSGTTFSIYIPASNQKVQSSIDTHKIVEGTGTVLLVDDEEMVLDVGLKLLESLGYTVLSAKSGSDAVKTYEEKKEQIDMVILDLIMPQMGGGETFDRLKEISPDVRVLLSSGYSIDGQAKEILKRGCDGFIQKPFSIEELSGKISEMLDRYNKPLG
jgi:CheY-like chemotaxis protein